jgi:hypothetical protein
LSRDDYGGYCAKGCKSLAALRVWFSQLAREGEDSVRLCERQKAFSDPTALKIEIQQVSIARPDLQNRPSNFSFD